ncbi:MAG: tRNA (adenosine(37)-N6)-threonylcarbamoyltransferase complex ATPase subunit type 1 TsaE [Clostridiales bacterium]|nr:tRNA (adenosine(37)-N6)-threonylcarbamoyltransferase complex ATPase subunit type 1 TsaE [Clostridiales bacterium]
MRTVTIKNEEDTRRFGLDLAGKLKAGDIVALIGDLGTGKTTLTKYIAEGLGVTERITSPTFTIVSEHHSGRLPLYHFDVYRLKSGEDMFDIGADEYFDAGGVCIIEWADQVAEVLPDETICIFIEYGEKEGERVYRCTF